MLLSQFLACANGFLLVLGCCVQDDPSNTTLDDTLEKHKGEGDDNGRNNDLNGDGEDVDKDPEAKDGSHCGLPNNGPPGKIMNGEIVSPPYRYPWYALIEIALTGGEICGGALITTEDVLTASHCIYDEANIKQVDASKVTVRLGNTNGKDELLKREKRTVEKIVMFPIDDGTEPAKEADITNLQLTSPITISLYILPICLPKDSAESLTSTSTPKWTVIGFGSTVSNSKQMNSKLMSAEVEHYPKQEGEGPETCSDIPAYKPFFKDKTMICAYFGNQGHCYGDSGGPLMKKEEKNISWVLVGLVSYGRTECSTEEPQVYANILKNVQWVRDNLKGKELPRLST